MKSLLITVSFSISLLLIVSCKKYLDVQPQNQISDEATIVDRASAEQALRGAYRSLGSGGYYGTSFQSIGYLAGDNIQWTGSQSQIEEFVNKNVRPENATIASAWAAIYQTINRANHVIEKVPALTDPTVTETIKKQILGQALFIRALAYFDLSRVWGGVPILTKPTIKLNDNIRLKRATITQTYDQITRDLDSAENYLPATTNRYRATKKTVWALKARFNLYRGDWAKAEDFATRIINDNNYSLVTPYESLITTRGSQESVFEIYYNGTTETNGHAAQWLPQNLGGTRQWAPNSRFVALVNKSDTGGTRKVLVSRDAQNRNFGNLYRSINASPSYVIRIAELYLIRAEARANQDKLYEALEDLNAVRKRAELKTLPLNSTDVLTKAQILLSIEDERRIEFAFEPHRWFDLVRTDRAKDLFRVNNAPLPNWRYVLPIPANERLKNPELEQNPNY